MDSLANGGRGAVTERLKTEKDPPAGVSRVFKESIDVTLSIHRPPPILTSGCAIVNRRVILQIHN